MRHFAHHIGDYAAATAHLSFVEDAAYHRLLRRYYQDEKPLPKEVSAVQRLIGARAKDEREAVVAVLGEFFTLEDDGWHQKRADEVIAEYRERAETARNNGRKSGGRPKPKENPPNNPKQTDDITKSVPTKATNHKPVTTREAPTGLPPDGDVETSRPAAARATEPLEGQRTRDDMPEIPRFLRRMPA